MTTAASTKIVIDRHMKHFSEGKLEAILSDYAPAAVLFTADGPLRGVDEIRPLFKALVTEFAKTGCFVPRPKPILLLS